MQPESFHLTQGGSQSFHFQTEIHFKGAVCHERVTLSSHTEENGLLQKYKKNMSQYTNITKKQKKLRKRQHHKTLTFAAVYIPYGIEKLCHILNHSTQFFYTATKTEKQSHILKVAGAMTETKLNLKGTPRKEAMWPESEKTANISICMLCNCVVVTPIFINATAVLFEVWIWAPRRASMMVSCLPMKRGKLLAHDIYIYAYTFMTHYSCVHDVTLTLK